MYRKQYDILWKYFKAPLITGVITSIGYPICTYNLVASGDFVSAIGVSSAVGLIYIEIGLWCFISQIILAKNFNRLYYENLKKILAKRSDTGKNTGTSIGNALLWMLVVSVIAYLPSILL